MSSCDSKDATYLPYCLGVVTNYYDAGNELGHTSASARILTVPEARALTFAGSVKLAEPACAALFCFRQILQAPPAFDCNAALNRRVSPMAYNG